MSRAAVFTISDSRSAGAAADESGPTVAGLLVDMGIEVVERRVIPDDAEAIRSAVRAFEGRVSLIVTTGGTGIGSRDVTPEAISPLFDRELPGFGEIMRTGSYANTPLSIISRGGAGIAGRTLIVMLPGSPNAVRDGLSLVSPAIRHVLKFLENQPVDCRTDSQANS
jgi:molybdenum cofactor synthesis domain-containing protein